MKKVLLSIILLTISLNGYSQKSKKNSEVYKIDTKDKILEKENGVQILIEKNLLLMVLASLPETEIERGTYILNYTVDEDGKIQFIKGHKGFPKIEVPQELIGIHFPYYEDDKFIAKLNYLITDVKTTHFINNQKQPDCKKLKNVVFYGKFQIATVFKKS